MRCQRGGRTARPGAGQALVVVVGGWVVWAGGTRGPHGQLASHLQLGALRPARQHATGLPADARSGPTQFSMLRASCCTSMSPRYMSSQLLRQEGTAHKGARHV